MKLENVNRNTWSEIKKSENFSDGYVGTFITLNDEEQSQLLIFLDENNKSHFVIEVLDLNIRDIKDPNINGLRLGAKQFRFNRNELKMFIDLECSREDYLDEFTGIIKEIAASIFLHGSEPIESVYNVIENWRSFLGQRNKEILSEEEQVGLFCELVFLSKLCNINATMALNSWRGPLGEKHDFIFSDWGIEIKGTRSLRHLHWINGIDQLKNPHNKKLAFISFLLTPVQSNTSQSIQTLIEEIVSGPLKRKSGLIESFYKLLIAAGYSKFMEEEYKKLQLDIVDCEFFIVDDQFPKLTSENLKDHLNMRVSEVRYKIDLDGYPGQKINDIQLGNYFY